MFQLAVWRRYQVAAAAALETEAPHGIACDGAVEGDHHHRPAHCYGCAFVPLSRESRP